MRPLRTTRRILLNYETLLNIGMLELFPAEILIASIIKRQQAVDRIHYIIG